MSREDEIVRAIADDLISMAYGDYRKAQILAAAYIPEDERSKRLRESNARWAKVLRERRAAEELNWGGSNDSMAIGFGNPSPRFGATEYAEDWK
jgi:DNA primase large subunit